MSRRIKNKLVLSNEITLSKLNGAESIMVHVHGAHSDEDSIVFFQNENLLYTGNIFQLSRKSNIYGLLKAIGYIISMSDDNTRILPGYGRIIDKSKLNIFYDYLKSIKDQIQERKQHGLSIEDLIKLNLLNQFRPEYLLFNLTDHELIAYIYNSM
ncbi:hypothetical protein [Marinoscillum pacificum]|uniref:hypothetical protein n=1 Tax=Marinoscillum pacificum TaxID=392723 RepID=UPI00215739CE|nr:hypothetical protein [Marinoscillum pacificum]